MKNIVLSDNAVGELVKKGKCQITRLSNRYKVGEILWVKESSIPEPLSQPGDVITKWNFHYTCGESLYNLTAPEGYNPMMYNYRNDPAISLPKWASRMNVEVMGVEENKPGVFTLTLERRQR